MREKLFFSLCLVVLAGLSGLAQPLKISGTVTDEMGEPLARASVKVKNTNTSTITNLKGDYSIEAKKGDILSFSYVGMEPQEAVVGNSMVIKIIMKPSAASLENVIVGYVMKKRSDLTGSVQTIRNSEFMKSVPVSIEQGMQGRLAGVNVVKNDGAPGGGISVQIRGTNSFMGSTEPLYVIDGVPIATSNDAESMTFDGAEIATRNALSFLNPDDVESIEVLRDASATAIYGSRGSNGVVMITTKSGKKGDAKITLTSNLALSQVANRIRMLSGTEYAEYRNQAYINTQLINTGTFNPQGLPYLGDVGPLGEYIKGPDDFSTGPYYWQDAIFRTGVSKNYGLSYSGATDKSNYSISIGYLDQQGTVLHSGYKRLSANVKLSQDVRSWLKLGTTVNFSVSNSDMVKAATSNQNNGDEGVIRSALYFPPAYTVEEDPGYEEFQLVSNPLTYTEAMNKHKNYSVYTSNYANVTLLKGLVFRTVFSYKAGMSIANRYFSKDLYEGRAVNGKSLAGDIQRQTYSWDNLLLFNRSFGKHGLNATLGTSGEDYSYYSKQVETRGFGYDGNNGWILGDGTNPQTPKSVKQDSKLFSAFARAEYSYAGKYYINGTVRRDASSKFARNNKVAYFSSIGLAWNVSQEDFLKNSNIVSDLKVRYSYGTSGNAGIGPYGSLLLLDNANYPFGNTVESGYAVVPTNPGNPNLKWETTHQHDLGINLSLFRKLDVEVDLYSKDTKDLIQRKELPSSSGYESVLYNIGRVNNKGIEVSLNYQVISNKNFQWSVGGNFSFNRNKVVSLGDAAEQIFPNILWNDLRPFVIQEGRPIGQLYGYAEEGIWSTREEVINSKQFQTIYPNYAVGDDNAATEAVIKQSWLGEVKIKDKDDNGSITESDQYFIGQVNPDYIYAFHTNFSFKGFDLSVLFNGVVGNDIINMMNLRYNNLGQTRNIPKAMLDNAWAPGNSGTNPKIYTVNGRDLYFSRRYIEDGSYLKLRNVSVGYTFKKPFKSIGSARLYVSMNNMWTITRYSGYDPEVNAFGSDPSSRGVDAGGYPQAREISFGINITP